MGVEPIRLLPILMGKQAPEAIFVALLNSNHFLTQSSECKTSKNCPFLIAKNRATELLNKFTQWEREEVIHDWDLL